MTFVGWVLLGGGLAFAIERAVTVMVLSCPHALGLAVPLVVAVSTTLTARNGLLIRDRAAFERARTLPSASVACVKPRLPQSTSRNDRV